MENCKPRLQLLLLSIVAHANSDETSHTTMMSTLPLYEPPGYLFSKALHVLTMVRFSHFSSFDINNRITLISHTKVKYEPALKTAFVTSLITDHWCASINHTISNLGIDCIKRPFEKHSAIGTANCSSFCLGPIFEIEESQHNFESAPVDLYYNQSINGKDTLIRASASYALNAQIPCIKIDAANTVSSDKYNLQCSARFTWGPVTKDGVFKIYCLNSISPDTCDMMFVKMPLKNDTIISIDRKNEYNSFFSKTGCWLNVLISLQQPNLLVWRFLLAINGFIGIFLLIMPSFKQQRAFAYAMLLLNILLLQIDLQYTNNIGISDYIKSYNLAISAQLFSVFVVSCIFTTLHSTGALYFIKITQKDMLPYWMRRLLLLPRAGLNSEKESRELPNEITDETNNAGDDVTTMQQYDITILGLERSMFVIQLFIYVVIVVAYSV